MGRQLALANTGLCFPNSALLPFFDFIHIFSTPIQLRVRSAALAGASDYFRERGMEHLHVFDGAQRNAD